METWLPDYPQYPPTLKTYRYTSVLPEVTVIGAAHRLGEPKLGLFCSGTWDEGAKAIALELLAQLRDVGVGVMGGFHSPPERDCLEVLMQGQQLVIECPARSLHHLRLSSAQDAAIAQNRLILLSPFKAHHHRKTAALAQQRNQFVAALADALLILQAPLGSKTEALTRQAIAWGKTCWTLPHASNTHLYGLGVQPLPTLPTSGLLF